MAVLSPGPIPRAIAIRARPSGGALGLIALLLLGLGAAPCAPAQTTVAREYQVKAVFLFNFAQFVEWPADAFPSPDAPLVIGVLGTDPFGHALHEAVSGDTVGGRPLLVRRYRRAEEIEDCHMLFIGASEGAQLEAITARLKSRSILTVADADGPAQRGVMIRFFTQNKRIRLKINLEAARAAGLVISSKLLRPAEIVTDREKSP